MVKTVSNLIQSAPNWLYRIRVKFKRIRQVEVISTIIISTTYTLNLAFVSISHISESKLDALSATLHY